MSDPLAVLDGLWLGYEIADQNEADRAAEASTQRLAAMTVRATACNHPCAGEDCLHRNHRRDQAHLSYLLAMLELPSEPATARDYASAVAWGSFTKEDVQLLR